MPITRRILHLMIVLSAFPLTASIVGQAYAKGRPSVVAQPEKANVVLQCMKDMQPDGDLSNLAMNQVCTCLVDKMPAQKHEVAAYLNGREGRKELGRCLFLAKDGL